MPLSLKFRAALLTIVAAALPAVAEPSLIDPKQYLDEKAYEEAKQAPKAEAIKQNVVRIDGRPYYKFGDGKSSILVPKTDHLSEADLQGALCAEDLQDVCDPNKYNPEMKEVCDKQGLREAMGASVQHELTKDTAVYLNLIVMTIQTSCGGDGRRQNRKAVERFFEIGLERKSADPRHPGSEKVFIRPNPVNPLAPEVGAGMSF